MDSNKENAVLFPRRVALVARSEMRTFQTVLMKELNRRFSTRFLLFCGNAQMRDFFKKSDAGALIDEVVVVKSTAQFFDEPVGDVEALYASARRKEEQLGTTINQLLVPNRHLGRGFALGGYYHPRSRLSEQTSYPQVVQGLLGLLQQLEKALTDYQVGLVLMAGKELCAVARSLGIPSRTFCRTRYNNYHYWGRNEYWETPEFERSFQQVDPAEGIDFTGQIYTYAINKNYFFERVSRLGMLKAVLKRCARQAWWRLRKYEKAKGYFLSEDLKFLVRQFTEWKKLKRLSDTKLKDLKDQKWVFCPLQTEPEYSVQGLSPENFYQLSTIAALARDMPAGVLLGVKETYWAVGRRPDLFYRQLREFKNVRLLDPLEPGQECVKAANAVALITGSAGLEAACIGKPVILLGRHSIFSFLKHVFPTWDDGRLPAVLAEVLAKEWPTARSLADGRRFLQAIVSRSYDMRGYDFVKQETLDQSAIDRAIGLLTESISEPWMTSRLSAQGAEPSFAR